jgi:hypothetical protein
MDRTRWARVNKIRCLLERANGEEDIEDVRRSVRLALREAYAALRETFDDDDGDDWLEGVEV